MRKINKEKRNKSQYLYVKSKAWALSYFGLFISVLIILSDLAKPISEWEWYSNNNGYIAVLLSIIVLIIDHSSKAQYLNSLFLDRVAEIEGHFKTQNDILSQYGHFIEQVGLANEASNLVAERVERSVYVKNVFHADNNSPVYIENIGRVYASAIKKSGFIWVDVLSDNAIGKNRYQEAKSCIININNRNGTYIANFLPETVTINFIILYYGGASNNSREAFFGWGLHEENYNGMVFKTNSDVLIDLFANYHSALCRKAEYKKVVPPERKFSTPSEEGPDSNFAQSFRTRMHRMILPRFRKLGQKKRP